MSTPAPAATIFTPAPTSICNLQFTIFIFQFFRHAQRKIANCKLKTTPAGLCWNSGFSLRQRRRRAELVLGGRRQKSKLINLPSFTPSGAVALGWVRTTRSGIGRRSTRGFQRNPATLKPRLRMLCAAGSRLVENAGVSYDPPHSGQLSGFGAALLRIRDDSFVLPVV